MFKKKNMIFLITGAFAFSLLVLTKTSLIEWTPMIGSFFTSLIEWPPMIGYALVSVL